MLFKRISVIMIGSLNLALSVLDTYLAIVRSSLFLAGVACFSMFAVFLCYKNWKLLNEISTLKRYSEDLDEVHYKVFHDPTVKKEFEKLEKAVEVFDNVLAAKYEEYKNASKE